MEYRTCKMWNLKAKIFIRSNINDIKIVFLDTKWPFTRFRHVEWYQMLLIIAGYDKKNTDYKTLK